MEFLPAGHELDWPISNSLNRLSVGVGRSKPTFKATPQDVSVVWNKTWKIY